jgi:hypothetical protein
MGFITKLIVLGVVGYGGYEVYNYHRAGYFDLPDLPSGAYTLSFSSGLRAIVLDAQVSDDHNADAPALLRSLSLANPDRRYIGFPYDVAPWFEKVWSTCIAPTDEVKKYVDDTTPEKTKNDLIGARFEAVCYIDIEGGDRLLRGLIYSVARQ